MSGNTLPPRSDGRGEVTIRVAVLASGSGTNLQALIDTADLGAEIAVVISDRADATALSRAESAGIVTRVISREGFESREAFSEAIAGEIEAAGARGVVLAGFMRILAPNLIGRFPNQILNIHPSLLPSFPGANAVARALEHGVKVTGVTVHFVEVEVDQGPIIAQRAVPVLPDDDLTSLHARIQDAEHDLYPSVVRAFARGQLTVQGRNVRWA
ncbi:MAG TPA: phosphoribosylglycinamide formyltransferase [Acidimicrobiia bacterium]|nr:phosphoribosylglycinamide formyltransferase [Acidimicrobiia bacterium]